MSELPGMWNVTSNVVNNITVTTSNPLSDVALDFTTIADLTTAEPVGGRLYIQKYPHVAIPYLLIAGTASFVGTVGNIMILAAVAVNRALHHSRNIFVVNLAIADLTVTAIADPFSIVGMTEGEDYFVSHPVICDVIVTLCLSACVAALFSIGGVGFNKYFQICHPIAYQKIFTFRNNILICVGFWMAGILVCLPALLGWTDNIYDEKYLECFWNRLHSLSFTIFFAVCVVAIPVIIISFSFLKIFLRVRESQRRVADLNSSADNKSNEPRRRAVSSAKLAKSLFIIFVIFVICWTPFALLVVCDFQDKAPQEVHLYILLLAHLHSTLNSVVYALTNVHFKRGYRKALYIFACKSKSFEQSECPDNSAQDFNTRYKTNTRDKTGMSVTKVCT